MSDAPPKPPGAPASTPPAAAAPKSPTQEMMETVVVEAMRDLKQFQVRELSTQLARMEERYERRIAEVEAEMKGIAVKLTAIRDELHQSLRDQTFKVAAIVAALLALGAAVWLLQGHLVR